MEKIDIEQIKQDFYKMKKINFKSNEVFEYYILDEEYIEKLEDFLDIMSKSTTRMLFARNTLEENKSIYSRGGKIIGVFENGNLAAITITDLCDEDNYMIKLANIQGEDISKTVILDTLCVLPQYRGNQLQIKLMLICEYLYLQMGYKYMLSTVSPMNYHSIQNYLGLNYIIFDLQELYANDKYNAVMRYLVQLEIGKTLEEVPEQYSVLNLDIERQKEVISLGFAGMKIINVFSTEKFFVSYSKAYYS